MELRLDDCVGLRRLLTLGKTVADRPVLPDTVPVGLTSGLPVARLAETTGDPLTDWLGLARPLTVGRTVPDKPMLGVTLPVELLAGLDDTDEDPVGHCDWEEETLLDPVRLLIAVELLLAHCVGLIEGLAVPTVAETAGELVCDAAAEEDALHSPVAL